MGPNYLIKLLAFLLFRCWLFTWLTLNSITWTIILPTTSVNLLIFQATKVRPNCFLNYFGFWLDELGKCFWKWKTNPTATGPAMHSESLTNDSLSIVIPNPIAMVARVITCFVIFSIFNKRHLQAAMNVRSLIFLFHELEYFFSCD